MSDRNHAIADDIAFMRTLAEAGRTGPMAGGSVLVVAGGVYAACSVATWAALTYQLNWSGFFPLVWFGGTLIFLAILYVMKRRLPRNSGAARSAGVVWQSLGWAIFAIVVSLMIIGGRTNAWVVMAALPSVILAMYGAAWFVAAVLTGARWLYGVAFSSFLMAMIIAWFVTDPATLYLIYGASLLGLLSLPGYLVMRQARAKDRAAA